MTIGSIHHVAIVVRSIEDSLPRYRDLFGLEPGRIFELPVQRSRVCFLPTGPEPAARLELVQPTDDESGVARFLASRGEGLHHVCFRSSDLVADLEALAEREVQLIDAEPRRGAEGVVAFVHPRALNGVLWELLTPPEPQIYPDSEVDTPAW